MAIKRSFQLVEGTSNKFWEIQQVGATVTVRFGRVGSSGQTKPKEFASEAEAARAAEKLIAEKTRGGYVERGGATSAPAKPAKAAKAAGTAGRARPAATATKQKTASGPAALLAALGPEFPRAPGPGLCFRKEDDQLFERGYPEMRRLLDEHVDAGKAAKRAESALDAIDPVFSLAIPRDIARRFLLGYRVGPLLFVDVNRPKENAKLRVERAAAIRSDRAIDLALLDETLDAHGWGMGDTYASWRMPKVVYLYEAFLGTEPVARALVRHLLRVAGDVKKWGDVGKDPERTNATPHHLALTLPWLMLRVEPRVAAELRKALWKARAPEEVGKKKEPRAYYAILRWIAEPAAALDPTIEDLDDDLALRTGDVSVLSARLDRLPKELFWDPGRLLWLLGTARLTGELKISGFDLPRMVEEVGPIRDAGVVRLIARIASQRAGKEAAAAWLREHASFATPVLERLAELSDEKERAAAEGALELIGAASPPPAARGLSEEDLEAEMARLFGELGKKLAATKGKDAQMRAIRDAHDRYTEARAAAGDPIPEAYFTHRFGDFGLGAWAMMAVDAID